MEIQKKIKNMLTYYTQNGGQYYNFEVFNKSFKHGEKFSYLEITITNQNCIHD
jgi:hypothetical protein